MKIQILVSGTPPAAPLGNAIGVYTKRIGHYVPLKIITTASARGKQDSGLIKREEADILLKNVNENDYVVLLDERGRQFSSVEFAQKISGLQLQNRKSVVFVIGGAYGFGKKMYERANEMLALSKMTLQHDIALLVFVEQLYRAFTIIRGEKYHH